MFIRVAIFVICVLVSELLGQISAQEQSVRVGVSLSQTVVVRGLIRVAIANTKIARVRAIAPDRVLITGMRPGVTTVRAWDLQNHEHAFEVTVLSQELYDGDGQAIDNNVVRVSLEFLELNTTAANMHGIQWPSTTQWAIHGTLHGSESHTGINYTLPLSTARGLIQHLVQEGLAKILARPELFVRLGEEAIFHSGGEFPVSTTSENFGKSFRHVDWKPFGLTVKVRPKSGDGYRIGSDIKVEISELNQAQSVDGIPSLTKRNLETKMQSHDGETVVLSGLVRKTSSKEDDGLPLLSRIPLVGYLFFSSHRDAANETELFMSMRLSFQTRMQNEKTIREMQSKWAGEGASKEPNKPL